MQRKKGDGRQRDGKTTLEVSGHTLPNVTVDIYICADPIVVSTKSDANGEWHYELSYHLPAGDHEAYSVVYHPDKGLVKSEVAVFNVAFAADDNQDMLAPQFQVTRKSVEKGSRNLLIGVVVGIVGGLAVLVLLFVLVNVWKKDEIHPSLQTRPGTNEFGGAERSGSLTTNPTTGDSSEN